MCKCNSMPLLTVGLLLTLRFWFENLFIKCSLILSSETLTLLYFASRIPSQCCRQLHLLKSEVFIPGGGGRNGEMRRVGDSAPSFWIFWIRPPLVQMISSRDRGSVIGTEDQWLRDKISARDCNKDRWSLCWGQMICTRDRQSVLGDKESVAGTLDQCY